jgi:hypothetical protein
MSRTTTHFSIITLNINGINSLIKDTGKLD